jgi:hypothetical protein
MHGVTVVTLQKRFNHNALSAGNRLSLGSKCDVARGQVGACNAAGIPREKPGTDSPMQGSLAAATACATA